MTSATERDREIGYALADQFWLDTFEKKALADDIAKAIATARDEGLERAAVVAEKRAVQFKEQAAKQSLPQVKAELMMIYEQHHHIAQAIRSEKQR